MKGVYNEKRKLTKLGHELRYLHKNKTTSKWRCVNNWYRTYTQTSV